MAKSKTKVTEVKKAGKAKKGIRRSTKNEVVVVKPALEKNKNARRRQIDPTTCEREYSEAELEFMRAMDEYKRHSGRMFPTCSEILEVLAGLGYQKTIQASADFVQS